MTNEINTCPACGKPGATDHLWNWWVKCSDGECLVTGPSADTEGEAIARWNAMPRNEDAQAKALELIGHDYVNVDNVKYSVSFYRHDAVTLCVVDFDGHITGGVGMATLHPGEEDKPDQGKRFALRRACDHIPGKDIYDAWRRLKFDEAFNSALFGELADAMDKFDPIGTVRVKIVKPLKVGDLVKINGTPYCGKIGMIIEITECPTLPYRVKPEGLRSSVYAANELQHVEA